MVCTMLYNQEHFTQQGLISFPIFYYPVQWILLIQKEVSESISIGKVFGFEIFPIPGIFAYFIFGPIIVGPFWFFIIVGTGEFHNVFLSEDNMEEQLVKRIWKIIRSCVDILKSDFFQHFRDRHKSLSASQTFR